MAKFKFNFGSDTSTTLFHNANASGNDFNMYTSCHTSGEPVFGNIRVSGTSNFSNIVSDGTVCFAQNVCITGGNRAVVVPDGYGALQAGSCENIRFCTSGIVYVNSKLGVGTATPPDKLSLIGDVGFINADNSTGDKGAIEWKTEHNYYDKVAWICGHRHAESAAPTSIRIGVGCVGGNGSGDVLTIGCNCNVGIGTNDPATALDIHKSIPTGGQIQIFESSTAYQRVGLKKDGSKFHIGEPSNDGTTSFTEILTVDMNGDKVGIGTASPDKPLEIYKDGLADNSSNTLSENLEELVLIFTCILC